MYIGPQGIVHGTTITLLNAGRKLMPGITDLRGKIFVTSGLGACRGSGLSRCNYRAVCVIAEVILMPSVNELRMATSKNENVYDDGFKLIERISQCQQNKEAIALIYHGNIVDLWEKSGQQWHFVELGSDQTSLHNIDDLGYCPQGISLLKLKTAHWR